MMNVATYLDSAELCCATLYCTARVLEYSIWQSRRISKGTVPGFTKPCTGLGEELSVLYRHYEEIGGFTLS